MNIAIFRENTEDAYAGIEFARGRPQAEKLIETAIERTIKARR